MMMVMVMDLTMMVMIPGGPFRRGRWQCGGCDGEEGGRWPEEGGCGNSDHDYHDTIIIVIIIKSSQLYIKVVPVYSREDIREQYCINDKELQVIPPSSNIFPSNSSHPYHPYPYSNQSHYPHDKIDLDCDNLKVLDRRKKGLLGCFSDTQPSPCTRHGDHHDHDHDGDHVRFLLVSPVGILSMIWKTRVTDDWWRQGW